MNASRTIAANVEPPLKDFGPEGVEQRAEALLAEGQQQREADADRRAFAAHPHIVATVSARPVRTDVALGAYDRAFAAFERFGWDGHTASVVMAALDFLVLGSSIETFKGGFDRPADAYDPDYPHLASALRAAGDDDIDDLGFELGLAAVVAWLSERGRGPRNVPSANGYVAVGADPHPDRERRAAARNEKR